VSIQHVNFRNITAKSQCCTPVSSSLNQAIHATLIDDDCTPAELLPTSVTSASVTNDMPKPHNLQQQRYGLQGLIIIITCSNNSNACVPPTTI
jgi:hypothetical protein